MSEQVEPAADSTRTRGEGAERRSLRNPKRSAVALGVGAIAFEAPERRENRTYPWWCWVLAGGVILAAGFVGVRVDPLSTPVAVWWPAAGLSVLWALLQRPRHIPHALAIVAVTTLIANSIAGRGLAVSAVFSVMNTVEVAVVLWILGSMSRRFELSSLRAGLRFVLAVLIGAVVASLGKAATVALLDGGDYGLTAVFVAASHASAVAMIAPLAAMPRSVEVDARAVEHVVQALLLAAVIALVFHEQSSMPVSFVPFPVMAWAALRFGIRFVTVETLLASIAMLLMTIDGGGPFRDPRLDLVLGFASFELLLVTFAGFSVVLSAAQYELRMLTRQVSASNRLLTGSVVDAQIGLVIAERGTDVTRVRWTNHAGAEMLTSEVGDGRWHGPLRTAAIAALRTGEQVTVGTECGRTISLAANALPDHDNRFAVQMFDVTEVLGARRAQLEAALEQEATRGIRAELERQRDDFLVTTSHELRTPITSIVGYAELLSGSTSLSRTEADWVRVVSRNAERLSELVEDLLTLSRGSDPRALRSVPRAVSCAELFDEVAATLRPLSERSGVSIEVDGGDHVALVSPSDASRMLANLVTNSCKFTPAGGNVRISAHAEAETVRIVVADTGPGMSDSEIAQAFQRFYRAPAAERDNVAGAGLGLAIVAELARRNRGTVQLRRGEVTGLVVELRFPAVER